MAYTNISTLTEFFGNAEDAFLDALQDGSHKSFLAQCQAACSQLSQLLSMGMIPHGTASNIFMTMRNISNMSSCLIGLSKRNQELEKESAEKVKSLLLSSSRQPAVFQDKQDSINSQIFRRWFVEHLDDPFPSSKTKIKLAADTNEMLDELAMKDKNISRSSLKEINKEQCQLWFINTRRRSKWTEFYRDYAFSSKEVMKKLIDTLRSDEKEPEESVASLKKILSQGENGIENAFRGKKLNERIVKCREEYYAILEWLEQVPREKASDWLAELINEAKSEYKATRRQKKDQRIRIHEFEERKIQELNESYESAQFMAAQPIKRRGPGAGRKRKAVDEDDGEPKELTNGRKTCKIASLPSLGEQMHPSTFDCDSSSSRTASGSSMSSINTISSIDSASSIEPPTIPIASSPLAQYGTMQQPITLNDLPNPQALYHQILPWSSL